MREFGIPRLNQNGKVEYIKLTTHFKHFGQFLQNLDFFIPISLRSVIHIPQTYFFPPLRNEFLILFKFQIF